MNGLRNRWLSLCPALCLAASLAHAGTPIWSDGFESGGASRWQITGGVWKIGAPTAGPPANSAGFHTHTGSACASTQDYGYDKDTRLICFNYNGSSTLLVPSADQAPRLRFWQWFNFGNALGYVEVSTDRGNNWTQISPTYLDLNGGGVWSHPLIDLTPYAGMNVQFAFHFTSGGCCGNNIGWYVDDVEVDVGAPVLNFPEGFESDPKTTDWSVDAGTWEIGPPTSGPGAAHTGTNCAATVLAGNYANNVNSRLISPPFVVPQAGQAVLHFWQWYSFNNALGFVEVNNGFTTTTTVTNTVITTNSAGSLDTNTYQLFGAAIAGYTTNFYWNSTIGGWTNSTKALGSVFDLNNGEYEYEAGNAPLASLQGVNEDYSINNFFPIPQTTAPTNFLDLQGATWNSQADGSDNPVGYFGTNYTTTYATNTSVVASQTSWNQVSGTFQNGSTLNTWVEESLDLSAYAGQTVQVAFHFESGTSPAAGWYVDDLSLGGPPVLTVPTNQVIIYAGQTLTVTNLASSPYATNSVFSFGLVPPIPVDAALDPDTGILTWPTALQQTGTYKFTVTLTDSVSQLSATKSFMVMVSKPPPPTLQVPPKQGIYAGQSLTVTNTATSIYGADSTFMFELLSGLTDPAAGLDDSQMADNGVLTWNTQPDLPTGKYTNVVTVADSVSGLSATNSFVIVVSNAPAPMLHVPARQTIYAGQTLTVTNTATSVFGVNSTFTFALLSGLTSPAAGLDVSELSDNGVLTWVTQTNLMAGTYTNKVTVADNISGLSATNSFVIVVSNSPPPVLHVPARQTIYAGQTLTVTNTATSVFGTNSVFTFALLSGLTSPAAGLNTSELGNNGVLIWATTPGLPKGSYTNKISVADSISGLSATNSFVIVVSNSPPPVLQVPAKQTLYAGQTLTVTNTATSVFGTNSVFTFALLSGLTSPAAGLDVSELTNNGVLIWATTSGLLKGSYTNKISVADSISGLSATNSFVIVVSNSPPPVLQVPARQTIYAGQTLTVTNTATSVFGTNSVFMFTLLSGLTSPAAGLDDSALANNGVLIWATTTSLPTGSYTNKISVQDSVSGLIATNSFVVAVSKNPPPPTLQVPPNQTIYAGQTLTLTNTATSIFGANSVFTFALLSGLTNAAAGLDVSELTNNGVLNWSTQTNLPGGNYLNAVTVEDSVSGLSATNFFAITVLKPSPPTLTTTPSMLVISAGQTLIVSNTASSVYANSSFTFMLFVGPTNVDTSTNGTLSWATTAAQPAGNYTNTVIVVDSTSLLRATNSFQVQVLLVPKLTVSPGWAFSSTSGFQFTLNAASNTTWWIEAATNLSAPATNWLPVFTNQTDANGNLLFTDLLATNFLQRYYRAVFP